MHKHFNKPETVPCKHCGIPTRMLGTKMCDGCWELETRIESKPKLARKILAAIDAARSGERGEGSNG